MIRSWQERKEMLKRIDALDGSAEKAGVLMAFEWLLGNECSTSEPLDEWVKEQEGRKE